MSFWTFRARCIAQLVTGLAIQAKNVVVAEIEENQLNAIAPVVETHI
jgi:hypothetical protein